MVFLQYYLTAHILQRKKEMIKRVILGLLRVSGH